MDMKNLKKEIKKVETELNKSWFNSNCWSNSETYFYLKGLEKGRDYFLKSQEQEE